MESLLIELLEVWMHEVEWAPRRFGSSRVVDVDGFVGMIVEDEGRTREGRGEQGELFVYDCKQGISR